MHSESQGKPFFVYRSSAGSGKTRSLSKEYLKLALRYKSDYYKHILAVTFTNKATQEMKDRILNYLIKFSKEEPDALANELKQELSLDSQSFLDRSQQALSLILHNYGQFSINTIDAFFQRVIRSFTREAGLMGNFRLEVDNDLILEEVVKRLLDDLGKDKDLTEWVIRFSRDKLREGVNWNITRALVGFAKEILKEDFKQIEDEVVHRDDPGQIKSIRDILLKEIIDFKSHMKVPAQEALKMLSQHNITVNDFNHGNNGTAWKFFHEWAVGNIFPPGPRVRDWAKWPKKDSSNRNMLIKLTNEKLLPILNEMIEYHDSNSLRFESAQLVLENFYTFGLLTDIVTKLTEYKSENNIMLIADASKFLNGIIDNSDTPFIYEKTGSFYNHFLIDEFQDTSLLQWKNFRPLLQDSLDQEQKSMVVGDVKQSVYRWRGSDLSLLQQTVISQIGKERTNIIELRTNYRSAGKIVDFNNLFFKHAAYRLTELTGTPSASDAYHDVEQQGVRLPDEGFVHLKFYDDWENTGKDSALSSLLEWVETLQAKGVKAGDIAILVRKNEEGQEIANCFLQYKQSKNSKPECCYDVISSDSLRLDAASSVSLLLSAFRYISNPRDMVSLGEFVIARSILNGKIIDVNVLIDKTVQTDNPLSPDVVQNLSSLPIEEVTESLIRLLELGKDSTELAYLQSFQDVVLEFSAYEKNDIDSFLEWWELNKTKKSIQSSSQVDAINIVTIHKAKGLQYKYVVVPFCNWNLNHEGYKAPVLWCRSDQPPFDKIGYMAIQYKSGMKKSFFADDYEREKQKIFLDNLNLLYVAFTRAENGLIVMGDMNALGKDPSSVGQLTNETIQNNPDLNKLYTESAAVFESGAIKQESKLEDTLNEPRLTLQAYSSVDWRKKLVIRTRGTEFFKEDKTDKRIKINHGILLHQVLSRIKYKSDVDDVIHHFHAEGIIMEEEKEGLIKIISSLMVHPLVGNWFSKEWTVKTEAPVLVPDGRPGRIDRVVFKQTTAGKKKAVIIDYKTGEKKQEDKDQVQTYALLLSQMGYVDVEAFLVYLFPLEVVPVLSKMNLSLF